MKLWDAVFPLIRLTGDGTRKFLQGQISSEIISLKEKEIIRTCWLSPVGKAKALLEVRIINNGAEILVICGKVREVFEGLERVIFPFDNVSIHLDGNMRRTQKMSFTDSWRETLIEWFSEGTQIVNTFENEPPANNLELEKWMILQGITLDFSLLNLETNPFELGLSDLVDLKKGCFLGQETMAKLNNVGYVKHELRVFKSSSDQIKIGDKLISTKMENQETNDFAGSIISCLNLSEETTIGLSFVRRKYLMEEELINQKSMLPLQIIRPISFVSM